MPLWPSAVEARLMRGPGGPAALLDAWGSMAGAAVAAAMSNGVFAALATGPVTAERLAHRLDADEATLHALLEALTALGYLVRRGGRYGLTNMARRNLLEGDRDGSAALRFWPRALPALTADLQTRLRDHAEPARDGTAWLRSHRGLAGPFLDWQVATAQRSAADLARRLSVNLRARHVVVQGGGDCTLVGALAQRYPALAFTVHDLAEANARGEEAAAAGGFADRVRFAANDLSVGPPPSDVDIFLVTQCLHRFDGDAQHRLMRKAMVALRPGGVCAIVEPAPVPSMLPAQAAAVRVQALWLHVIGGHTVPTAAALAARLRETGFAYARARRLRGVGLSLVTGRRPRVMRRRMLSAPPSQA